jgi:hypothetical protein
MHESVKSHRPNALCDARQFETFLKLNSLVHDKYSTLFSSLYINYFNKYIAFIKLIESIRFHLMAFGRVWLTRQLVNDINLHTD